MNLAMARFELTFFFLPEFQHLSLGVQNAFLSLLPHFPEVKGKSWFPLPARPHRSPDPDLSQPGDKAHTFSFHSFHGLPGSWALHRFCSQPQACFLQGDSLPALRCDGSLRAALGGPLRASFSPTVFFSFQSGGSRCCIAGLKDHGWQELVVRGFDCVSFSEPEFCLCFSGRWTVSWLEKRRRKQSRGWGSLWGVLSNRASSKLPASCKLGR